MAQFDVENLNKLEAAVNGVEELIEPMKQGIAHCEEVCKETGAKNLIETAANSVIGVNEQCKSLAELVETLRNVIIKQRQLSAAVGND